jgi:hypothetical protein
MQRVLHVYDDLCREMAGSMMLVELWDLLILEEGF